MSKQDKLIQRLMARPSDVTGDELLRLTSRFGYRLEHGSGSRRTFVNRETATRHHMREPHPRGILKAYQVQDVPVFLRKERQLP